MKLRALHIFGGALVAATAACMVSGTASASPQDSGYDWTTGLTSYDVRADNDGRATVNVTFQRDDLKSGAGAEHVYWMIRDAAQSACGDTGNWFYNLQRQADTQQCENRAIESAVERVNAPELTDIYDLNAAKHSLRSPG
ncbi:MAG TPA: UrcA family protein [Steroidobacteraceae bacterium]|jgi:UrcA family protein